MNKKKTAFFIATFFVLTAFFYPQSGQAKTTVTREGCDITITVYLAFAFNDDVGWANSQQLISDWTDGMLDVWNEPDFTYSTGLCECPVHFEVAIDVLPKEKDCSHAKQNMPGWHCVNIVNEPVNQRGNIADAHQTPVDNGDGFGEWSTMTTGLNAAHEVGHFMGLGEEYHRDANGNWQPDDPQKDDSIMARTWGDVKAYPEHIDEIIDNSSVDCPEPECCCGNGEHEGYDQMMGEECDYTADPSGCEAGEVCNNNCECVSQPKVTPICGDGHITAPKEECDPQSKPTGCSADKDCIGCKCQAKEEPEPPAPSPSPEPGDQGQKEPAEMVVEPDYLEFLGEKKEDFFSVQNSGEETLFFQIEPELPEWLSVSPFGGEVEEGEEIILSVSVYPEKTVPGVYEYPLLINSNGGEKQVWVSLISEPLP